VHKTETDAARPEAIEDPSNLWFVHPVSWRLLPVALRLDIHPNTVSFAGMGCALLAGLCYWNWQQPGFVLAGFALMVAWHILDGLDGKLARASGKASPLGRVIDGVCDYLSFFFVLLPIALSLSDWQAALSLALVSGIFHAAQSAWYEGEREAWKRRLAGTLEVAPRPPGPAIAAPYNWAEERFNRSHRKMDAALTKNPALLQPYLAATATLIRRLSILSANNRTIAIAVACLVGNPRLYWYWEIAALTIIAIVMNKRLRKLEASIAAISRQTI
jgi:phosphatidylglycerophosphate synthase